MTIIQLVTRTKLLGLVGLLLLSGVAVKLHLIPPAEGYEISIYQSYAWYFWAALIGTIFIGQVIIIQTALQKDADGQFWYFGLALIFVANAVILFLPYIRGYPVYGRADTLTHLGFIQDLTTVGPGENMYPLTHILTHVLSHATGLESTGLINFLSPVFSYVFLGGLFYIIVYSFETRSTVLSVLPFATILIGKSSHINVAPFELSVLFVPFVLYLFIKEQRTNAVPIRVALIVSVIGVVIYHPLTAVFLLLSFAIYRGIEQIDPFGNKWAGPTTVTSLLTVTFAAWYLNFLGVIRRFEFVVESVFGSAGDESDLGGYTETVDSYSPAITDLIQIALHRYGLEAVLLTLAGGFMILAVYQWFQTQRKLTLFSLFFIGSYLLFSGLGAFFLITDLIVGFERPLFFGSIFAVILAGSLFYHVWDAVDETSRQTVVSVSVGIALLALVILSVFTMYPTPNASETNHQVTAAEIDGTEWLFENRNEELLIDEIGLRQFRFDNLHYGTTNTSATIRSESTAPPRRLGYEENETLGESYDQDRYLIISQLGMVSYPERFPEYRQHWRYIPEDFEQLENDHSVSRLYDNGEFKSYHVTAREEQRFEEF